MRNEYHDLTMLLHAQYHDLTMLLHAQYHDLTMLLHVELIESQQLKVAAPALGFDLENDTKHPGVRLLWFHVSFCQMKCLLCTYKP